MAIDDMIPCMHMLHLTGCVCAHIPGLYMPNIKCLVLLCPLLCAHLSTMASCAPAAHGGMVFLSRHTREQLDQEWLANDVILWR